MMTSLFQCCAVCRNEPANTGELRVVQLSSDVMEYKLAEPVHLLTRADSFDMTVTPRTSCKGDVSRTSPCTPRQQSFRDRLQLPMLRRYPVPPSCNPDDPEDRRRQQLLQLYQEFVLDLHKGIHMTQLTSNQDYSDIHCQILEDLQTLKVDQGSGCIIEFPLSAVSKVYRIVKNDDKWYSAGSLTGPTPMPPLPLSNAEHIVVVEFMRRRLAFVFNEIVAAQSFLMCMELLIRRAQECRYEPASGLGATGAHGHKGAINGLSAPGMAVQTDANNDINALCQATPPPCAQE
eukprot:gnl/TRDRNA2_/TRDRNA2_41880_c0_seq1.p1 gnl/TRDRNA2_/TRDRNA2_41880_c0~~gnl/TRDRNA2_/TRDRNA2_41880_c0_seq1.p1  ORF type:complete len:290 (+),score=43.72 gnl/TRDRNA2_/TRDRNA2_41880_c0_seq1:106-975(+)